MLRFGLFDCSYGFAVDWCAGWIVCDLVVVVFVFGFLRLISGGGL